MKILYAEDEPVLSKIVAEGLEESGYEVSLAQNGQDAYELFSAIKPDICILDIMMPVKDGFQFKAEQEVDPLIQNIPVIIMSANGNMSAKKELGTVKEFLKKPIDLDALLETINKYLN